MNPISGLMTSLFGPSTPPAAAPAQPTGSNQPPGTAMQGTAASGGTAPNGVVPAGGSTPPAGSATEPPSPLAAFTDIWKTDGTAPPATVSELFAGLDPKKIMESASKVDFTKAVTPDILAKIQAGGPEAQAALLQALNSVTQQGYAQSTMATAKLVEHALTKAKEIQDAQLPAMVKRFSVNESLMTENPLLQNPALQPLAGALQEQLIRKNPNASAQEIQQQVMDYFQALGQSFAPKPPETPASRSAAKEMDWSKFF